MILHKYIDAVGGTKTLDLISLKVSPANSFNDPFDCNPANCENWIIDDIQKFILSRGNNDRIYKELKSKKLVNNRPDFIKKIQNKDFCSKSIPALPIGRIFYSRNKSMDKLFKPHLLFLLFCMQ